MTLIDHANALPAKAVTALANTGIVGGALSAVCCRRVVRRAPRMAEVQRQTSREIEHSYAADEVPDGVTVPADAERVTQQRRKLNPDYYPTQIYKPRADRPEWDTVGLMGKLRVLKGQPVGARWIKMRDVSAEVEEWLVR